MSWDKPTGERGSFVCHRGKFLHKDKVPKEQKNISHNVIQDTIAPVRCNACFCGKTFESRSAYNRHLKELGFEVTGGDHLKDFLRAEIEELRNKDEREQKEMEETVKKAVMDVKYDRVKFTEKQKETFKREERAWGKSYLLKNPY